MEEQKTITFNIELLKWYFSKNKKITDETEMNKLFTLMSYSLLEDTKIFMRILLYIANRRRTDEQEIAYKILVHFMGVMSAELVFANLDLIIDFGKKNDILYFLQCQNITSKTITYIKHKAKIDNDFKSLLEGKLLNDVRVQKVFYKPENNWNEFLIKILDDPIYNGITVPVINTQEQEL